MRVAITRTLILKNREFNYEISPGSYFLQHKKQNGSIWLMIEGRGIGLPLKKWKSLKNKGVIPKSFLAKIIFILPCTK